MQGVQPHIMIPKPVQTYQLNSLGLTATYTKVAFVTIYPETGSIEKLIFRTRTIITAQTIKVSLQGVDSNGDPDGVILNGGNAYGTLASPAPGVSYAVTMVGAASVTRGVAVAVVFEWDSTAGSLAIASGAGEVCNNMYTLLYSAGSWGTKNGETPLIGFEYSDGFHGGSTWPVYNVAATTFNSSSNPDEIGLYMQMPVSLRSVGVSAYVNLSGAADMTLYDDGDGVLASVSMQPGIRWNAAMAFNYHYFEDVDLVKGRSYRLAIKPTTATDVLLMEYTLPASIIGIMNSLSGGDGFYRTSRADGGAWSEVEYMRPVISLFAGGFEEGGGPRRVMTPAGGHSIYR